MNIAKSNKIIPFIESLYISLENQVLSMKLSTIITNILKVKNISVEYLTDALKNSIEILLQTINVKNMKSYLENEKAVSRHS